MMKFEATIIRVGLFDHRTLGKDGECEIIFEEKRGFRGQATKRAYTTKEIARALALPMMEGKKIYLEGYLHWEEIDEAEEPKAIVINDFSLNNPDPDDHPF